MLKFGNREFRNIQEQVEKNAKDIEKLIEEGGLPPEKPTDNGQILLGNINGSVEWSTQTLPEIWNHADVANRTANEAKTSVTALDTRVTTLEQTTATKTYVDEQIQAKLNGSY